MTAETSHEFIFTLFSLCLSCTADMAGMLSYSRPLEWTLLAATGPSASQVHLPYSHVPYMHTSTAVPGNSRRVSAASTLSLPGLFSSLDTPSGPFTSHDTLGTHESLLRQGTSEDSLTAALFGWGPHPSQGSAQSLHLPPMAQQSALDLFGSEYLGEFPVTNAPRLAPPFAVGPHVVPPAGPLGSFLGGSDAQAVSTRSPSMSALDTAECLAAIGARRAPEQRYRRRSDYTWAALHLPGPTAGPAFGPSAASSAAATATVGQTGASRLPPIGALLPSITPLVEGSPVPSSSSGSSSRAPHPLYKVRLDTS